MNETIERLKYYRYFAEKTIKRLNMLDDALMYNGLGAYVEDVRKVITVLELLPELIEALDYTTNTFYGGMSESWRRNNDLIQKAKGLMGYDRN